MIIDSSERIFYLFQRFWSLCVFYDLFNEQKQMHPIHRECLGIIATKSPALAGQGFLQIPSKSVMPLKLDQIQKVERKFSRQSHDDQFLLFYLFISKTQIYWNLNSAQLFIRIHQLKSWSIVSKSNNVFILSAFFTWKQFGKETNRTYTSSS